MFITWSLYWSDHGFILGQPPANKLTRPAYHDDYCRFMHSLEYLCNLIKTYINDVINISSESNQEGTHRLVYNIEPLQMRTFDMTFKVLMSMRKILFSKLYTYDVCCLQDLISVSLYSLCTNQGDCNHDFKCVFYVPLTWLNINVEHIQQTRY